MVDKPAGWGCTTVVQLCLAGRVTFACPLLPVGVLEGDAWAQIYDQDGVLRHQSLNSILL